MKKNKPSLIYFFIVLSLLAFFLVNRLAGVFEYGDGHLVNKINFALNNLGISLQRNLFSIETSSNAIVTGLIGSACVWLFYLYNFFVAKNKRPGEEHGSAEWASPKDIKPFIDSKNPDKNIILSATEMMTIGKAKRFEYDRNKNILIIGGSGCGKTYGYVKPNLCQLHGSYVVTDPKGTVLPDTGRMLVKNGYEIRCLNTINFKKSMHYNPFAYIRNEADILRLVNVLIVNTQGKGDQSKEDFWVKAERLFYTALIAYIHFELDPDQANFGSLIDIMDMSEVKEDDENYKSPVDLMFEDLEKLKPGCFACRQYKKFKFAAGKTLKSILISCGARLAPFDIQELRDLMAYDELALDEIGDRKTALFAIMSDTDTTFSFLVAMMFSQMFSSLCTKADDEYGGRLPFPVHCILDEFSNIGEIPMFDKLISTIRSRGISASVILQSQSQLKALYKDAAGTIVDCCDTFLFLGGKGEETGKLVATTLGKSTIDNTNTSISRGQSGSYSRQDQVLGRELLDAAEVGKLGHTECIVMISGMSPFRSKKYDLANHPRFPLLADADKQNHFDITKLQEVEGEEFLDNSETVELLELTDDDLEDLDLIEDDDVSSDDDFSVPSFDDDDLSA